MRARFAGERGFSYLEMVVLLVIVSIVTVAAVANMTPPGVGTVSAQSHRLARDIRHMQVLAQTWGRSLQLTAVPGVNGTYSVSCVTSGAAPCDVSPVLDPVTGQGFAGALQQGVTLAVSGTDSNPKILDFQGRPLKSDGTLSTATGTYTLTIATETVTVAVAPITGMVTVTP
jgi:type II secretory pathway pseudopilin PulG